jgi:rhodanese-related sulfurtransferase
MRALEALGWLSLGVAAAVVAVYMAWRWWRRRVGLAPDLARVSVDELKGMISGGDKPLIVDVRGSTTQKIDPRQIPDAMAVSLETIEHNRDDLPRDRKIVLYCACPNEATAAKAARLLLARGYGWVRPLTGGLDAWNEALAHDATVKPAAVQLSNPASL